jgi:hypothetical protein
VEDGAGKSRVVGGRGHRGIVAGEEKERVAAAGSLGG